MPLRLILAGTLAIVAAVVAATFSKVQVASFTAERGMSQDMQGYLPGLAAIVAAGATGWFAFMILSVLLSCIANRD